MSETEDQMLRMQKRICCLPLPQTHGKEMSSGAAETQKCLLIEACQVCRALYRISEKIKLIKVSEV